MRNLLPLLVGIASLLPSSIRAGGMDRAYGQTMPAATLAAEFENNEIAADLRYRDKRLVLGGKVKKLGVDDNTGSPYVILDSAARITLKCVFPREAMTRLSVLKPGANIAVAGTVAGKREHSPYVLLQDCLLR